MKTYNTISEIKEDNERINHSWFTHGAMQFFKTKIESEVIKNCYFITSEINPSKKKAYSIRICLNGKIETIGKFHSFTTKQRAIDFINDLPEQFPEAFKLAEDTFNGKLKNDKTNFLTFALANSGIDNNNPFPSNGFTKACKWLIENYNIIDASWIRHFKKDYDKELSL